jgi:hypothetical protein
MRFMSFSLTTPQIKAGTKTVTRRLGWADLKPGEQVMACVKCMGIPKGGHVEKIRVIECVSNREEPLCQMTNVLAYGDAEVKREGFPKMTPQQFVDMFCKHMKVEAWECVNRVEFRYIDP